MTVHRLGDPAHHFWLTRSVARVMGLSLAEAMTEGRLTKEEFARMVTRCRGCGQVSACEHWLGASATLSDSAPPQCLNGDVLNALAKQ